MKVKNFNRKRLLRDRHRRILSRVREGNSRIRLRITKTNSHFYVQALNDAEQRTVASSSSLHLKRPNGNRESCRLVAEDLARKLKSLSITELSVDRGGHSYHGRIALVVDILRGAGFKL